MRTVHKSFTCTCTRYKYEPRHRAVCAFRLFRPHGRSTLGVALVRALKLPVVCSPNNRIHMINPFKFLMFGSTHGTRVPIGGTKLSYKRN